MQEARLCLELAPWLDTLVLPAELAPEPQFSHFNTGLQGCPQAPSSLGAFPNLQLLSAVSLEISKEANWHILMLSLIFLDETEKQNLSMQHHPLNGH